MGFGPLLQTNVPSFEVQVTMAARGVLCNVGAVGVKSLEEFVARSIWNQGIEGTWKLLWYCKIQV